MRNRRSKLVENFSFNLIKFFSDFLKVANLSRGITLNAPLLPTIFIDFLFAISVFNSFICSRYLRFAEQKPGGILQNRAGRGLLK